MNVDVVGESCIDRYIYGICERICPEGPVPVFNRLYEVEALGMASNTYNNMVVFFDNVSLVSNNPKEITKTRFVDIRSNQLLLRVDENDQCERISEHVSECDIMVVSDYCKGFLANEDIATLGKLANRLSVLDTKRKLTQKIIDSYSFIKVSEKDYLANKKIIDSNKHKVVTTLGEKGVRFLGKVYEPRKIIQTFDVSGAGDVFTAAFTHVLSAGYSPLEAIDFAQNCCSQVIQKKGTCTYEKDMD